MGNCESQLKQFYSENEALQKAVHQLPAIDKCNSHRCGEEIPDDDYVNGRIMHYDDEVKPAQWELSEKAKWKEEVTKKPHSHRQRMAEWRDINRIYALKERFQNGAYGVCIRGFCKTTGFDRAVIHVPKVHTEQVQNARLEAKLLEKMKHPNILTLFDEVEDNVSLYLIIDICEGGTLSSWFQDKFYFKEFQALAVMRQLLSAVCYLHDDIRVCHRDLRLENLLLSNKEPVETSNILKVADFRKCAKIKRSVGNPEGLLTEIVTAPHYCAPEVVRERYTERCDCWSCGVLMYVFLCGQFPFQGSSKDEIFANVLNGNFTTAGPLWDRISDSSKSLLRSLLKYKFGARLPAKHACHLDIWEQKFPMVQYV